MIEGNGVGMIKKRKNKGARRMIERRKRRTMIKEIAGWLKEQE